MALLQVDEIEPRPNGQHCGAKVMVLQAIELRIGDQWKAWPDDLA
jgi:hypothetical protein